MQWGIVGNGFLFLLVLVAIFFLVAFGVLFFFPVGTVLDVSLWWQILLPLVCLLIHMYIGFFTEKRCLFYSSMFNLILWGCWLLFLIWFLPVLLNRYTVALPILLLFCIGFLGAMLGRSLARVVAKNTPPEE